MRYMQALLLTCKRWFSAIRTMLMLPPPLLLLKAFTRSTWWLPLCYCNGIRPKSHCCTLSL